MGSAHWICAVRAVKRWKALEVCLHAAALPVTA
jgi:hypothetical protein